MARLFVAMSLAAALGLFPRPSWAQAPSALVFQDRPDALRIWAKTLSVNERNQTATFSGHVVVTRGTARMECATLVVHYRNVGPDRRDIDRYACKPDYVRLAD